MVDSSISVEELSASLVREYLARKVCVYMCRDCNTKKSAMVMFSRLTEYLSSHIHTVNNELIFVHTLDLL